MVTCGAAAAARCRSAWLLLPDGQRVRLTAVLRASISLEVERMGGDALRCLALAFRDDLPAVPSVDADPELWTAAENELVWIGLVSEFPLTPGGVLACVCVCYA